MGCVPSKLFKQELKQEILLNNGGNYINHVVSLTFSTYGVLNLDSDMSHQRMQGDEIVDGMRRKSPDGFEVINSWELMDGVEGETHG
ncbi:unnamed protein product [Rhodiola kirilowii]